MAETDVDLFVIGAGSGGVRAARVAAEHGARVMIAEQYRVGGTCVIRGCIPKKLLIYASRFRWEFEDAVGFGWSVEDARFDWPTLIRNKDKEIVRLESVYRANLEKSGVEIVDSRAVIEDDHTLRVLNTGARVRTDKILIATGGHPHRTPCLGVEHAITSDEAFQLPELPRRIAILGAGYVALEFAGIFEGLGSQVTIVHRGDEILRGFDADVRRHVHDEIEARGVRIMLKHTVSAIDKAEEGLRARLSDDSVLEVDQIMLAVGRRPNTTNLGLETAGVSLDPLGRVVVDENNRSDVHSIYAIGDVTNRLQLTPIAIREGHAFADSVFGNNPWIVDHAHVPTAVFTEPEVGVIGESEAAARVSGRKIKIFRKTFRPLKATLSGRRTEVFMKLVVDEESDRVLGVHVVGEGAAEMAQLAAVAVKMGARKADFDATLALHPTAAEELVTLHSEA